MAELTRRDRGLGASSARALLFTVLGEYVLPTGGSAWTSTLIDALGALGVEEKATRQTIARTAARGWLRSERVGRRVRWQLTEAADELLVQGTERIFSFGRTRPAWDGRWLVLFTSVPESRRELRYRLRTRLGWAGFGAPSAGVWISPKPEREAEASQVLKELGLADTATSFVGEFSGIGEVQRLVAQAWDVAALEASYEEFLDTAAASRPRSDRDHFVALTNLVHEWRRFPFLDPDLPPELLPERWSGARAAEQFHRLHGRWRPRAMSWWEERAALS